MYITLTAWILLDKEMGYWALAAPVTIILTIPGLRALFVGNPPFGEFPPWTAFDVVVADCVHSRVGILAGEDVMPGEYVDNQLICLRL